MHGALGQEQVAKILGTSRVGLIPYVANSYTAGVFPLKVYEYMAAGLPVLATGLPSLTGTPGVTLVHNTDEFLSQMVRLERTGQKEIDDQMQFARGHSWEDRTHEIERLMIEVMA